MIIVFILFSNIAMDNDGAIAVAVCVESCVTVAQSVCVIFVIQTVNTAHTEI